MGAHLIDVDLSFLVDTNRTWIHLKLFFFIIVVDHCVLNFIDFSQVYDLSLLLIDVNSKVRFTFVWIHMIVMSPSVAGWIRTL